MRSLIGYPVPSAQSWNHMIQAIQGGLSVLYSDDCVCIYSKEKKDHGFEGMWERLEGRK